MTKKETVLKNLTAQQKEAIVSHFNTIYKCSELSETENRIIYLAWLWNEGYVTVNKDAGTDFNEKEAGVPLTDYEITFEDEDSGGINLVFFYEYYGIIKIIELLGWSKKG